MSEFALVDSHMHKSVPDFNYQLRKVSFETNDKVIPFMNGGVHYGQFYRVSKVINKQFRKIN